MLFQIFEKNKLVIHFLKEALMKRILMFLSIGGVVSVFLLGIIGIFVWHSGDDNQLFTKEKILEILARETILYYEDGHTQLGSLFGGEHRLYITIDRVPEVMKEAIVSAEDESFYRNFGIDLKSIIRAGSHNFLYGTRQGASTITQQTVKNLYGRSKTNLATKFQEMLHAFKLEKHFSKDEILEFYLNQFHVTGNGRGVGIAAKYYFDKDVEDLNLVESAFIAASVKGPDRYTPYTKTTHEKQEKARKDAFNRKNYVLDRMLKTGKITESEYDFAVKEPVPFNQGKFQYNEIAIGHIVQRQLSRPEVLAALDVETLDEIANKGYHITTTLNSDIQKSARYGLRQNLSRIQIGLHDFEFEKSNRFSNIQQPELYGFYTAKVLSKDTTYRAESIEVSLGVPKCLVDTKALGRIALFLDQIGRTGIEKSKAKFLNTVEPGNYLLVSIRDIADNGDLFCDIETRPTVQGGAIAIDKGQIISLVGGFSTHEYNRAIFAQRQPGSTFKMPVFYAGLQLGWTALDAISNIRDVFTWQGQFYYPRPDHLQKSLETTLVGAGVKSENVASVWLLRHLTNKLSYAQYEKLLSFLKILSPDEPIESTLQKISDKFNVYTNDNNHIREGILDDLKSDLLNDISVMSDPKLKIFAYTLHYGNNFEKERARVQRRLSARTPRMRQEKAFRLNALQNNLIRWKRVSEDLNEVLEDFERNHNFNTKRNGYFALSENKDHIVFISSDRWKPELTSQLVEASTFQPLSSQELRNLFFRDSKLFASENVYVDGVVPLGLLNSLVYRLDQKFNEVEEMPPLEKLYWNADFRYSIGMYYTAHMLNGMGVRTPFDWVPSLPLGSNPITIAELAMIYQTFLTGKTYKFYDDDTENQLAIIKRIEDNRGNLLWEYESHEFQYVDESFSVPMLNALRSVVLAGTGSVLNWDIILQSNNSNFNNELSDLKIRVPNFGKTGTTNDFTNGTYVGFIPYPTYEGSQLTANNAITIATYIGNDDNTPMRRGWYRVYGGGAIPAWKEVALSIIKNKDFAKKLNWKTPSILMDHALPFYYGSHMVNLMVPINSNVNVGTYRILDRNNESLENDYYLTDYSEKGLRFVRLSLSGQISDNIFIPKRKVSFYKENFRPLFEAQRRPAFDSMNIFEED